MLTETIGTKKGYLLSSVGGNINYRGININTENNIRKCCNRWRNKQATMQKSKRVNTM